MFRFVLSSVSRCKIHNPVLFVYLRICLLCVFVDFFSINLSKILFIDCLVNDAQL